MTLAIFWHRDKDEIGSLSNDSLYKKILMKTRLPVYIADQPVTSQDC